MEIGKLPNEILEKIVISNIDNKRKDVLSSSGIGEDTAIIDFGEEVCVLSTDPITGATKDLGKLAVNISANDVSTSGGDIVGVLITLLVPPTASLEDIEEIMKDANKTAKELNIEIIGGHTEVTDAVNRIVVSSTVVGRQKKEKLPDKSRIKVGDKIVVTKYIGIEGTSIIAKEKDHILAEYLSKDEINCAKGLDAFLSVIDEGKIAGELEVGYMHDITEGGVLGAIWEAGIASGKGVLIDENSIPILDITRDISKIFKIDPLRLISSGSMLIVISDEKVDDLREKLSENGIVGTVIGEIVEEGIRIERDGIKEDIKSPDSDELYKVVCQ